MAEIVRHYLPVIAYGPLAETLIAALAPPQPQPSAELKALADVHEAFLKQVRKCGVKVDLYSMALQTDLVNERAESAEQQLAAAQAALFLTRKAIDLGDYSSSTAKHLAAQPTDALRAFVLGLLPEKRPPAHISSSLVGLDVTLDDWNKVLEQIRANLDAALGEPRAGRDLEGK